MSKAFEVGDRVKVISEPSHADMVGWSGVVVLADLRSVCVRFNGRHHSGLHRCSGLTPDHDGRWFESNMLAKHTPAFNLTLATPIDNVDEASRLAQIVAETLKLPVQVTNV